MASQSTGIQQLLFAEKKASETIMEARKRKTRRIKQAKDEAAEEVALYKLQREAQLKALATSVDAPQKEDGCEPTLETDTQAKIDAIDAVVALNKEKVINDILAMVCDIKPELHKNFAKKIE